MAGYFEEMGWRELGDGEQPNHYLELARYFADCGLHATLPLEWPKLPPPAAKKEVAKLPDVVVDDNSKSCPICLKNFESGTKAIEMPCRHLFHGTCILTWLAKTNSCPFCRYELPTDDIQYEAYKKEKKRAAQVQKDLENLHNSMFS